MSLKKCLKELSGSFSEEEESTLIESSDKYKSEGMSDLEADTHAVLDFHESLHNELNDLKKQVKQPTDNYFKPNVKQVEADINAKYENAKKELKVKEKKDVTTEESKGEKIEVSENEINRLLDSGYTKSEIDKAINEANRLTSLPRNELFKELDNIKMFASVGQKLEWRFDTRGLSTKEFESAKKNILEGKDNLVSVQKVYENLDAIKKNGTVPMIGLTGGMTEYANIPLMEFLLEKESNPGVTKDFPITDQEINDYLAYEVSQNNQEKNEPLQKVNVKELEQQYKNIKNGSEIYKRFSQKEQRGFLEGGRANVEASIIAGRSIDAIENQDERNDRQEEEVKKYAQKVGIWHDNAEDFIYNKGIELEGGQESIVHYNEKDGYVYKSSVTNQYLDLQDFLDGITIHNTYFPASKIEVIGFGLDSDGEFNVITKQLFIQGTHNVSQSQIDDYMQSIGFKKGDSVGRFKNNDVLINDVTPKNVILTKEGNIIPFDTIPHLNSKVQPMNENGTRIGIHEDYLKDVKQVIDVIKKALPKITVVIDDSLKGISGKVGKDGKIYINPNYAGLDTPIHEAGHILIDSIGYDNKVIQSAIKQLRNTDLYKETESRYPELSKENLDKEVLAEAIGREGADIFNTESEKSKFKAYLDYIFDWLKQKLGLDKNVAKSLAKQIISGIGTKKLEGVATGKEQLQKNDTEKKKNPIGPRRLSFEQYATEHGFSYEKETEKIEAASEKLEDARVNLKEIQLDGTKEEIDAAQEEFDAAKKEFAIAGKRIFEYKQYKKDFATVQEILSAKDLEQYTTEELQDLLNKLRGFNNKAAKSLKEQAMLRLGYAMKRAGVESLSKNKDFIESMVADKDIGTLAAKLLHISHFTESNTDMQQFSLAVTNAMMDKIADANSKKETHEKLGRKVIAEENKKLGITGAAMGRISSDSAKYFEWMADEDGKLMTVEEAKAKGLSEAKINYLKFTRETIAENKDQLIENDYENIVMDAIRVDKGFMEAFKTEGVLAAFSYYLGGGATNLGKVRIVHNGKIKSYSEIEREILSTTNRKDISSLLKGLWELLKANVQARRQLKKGINIDNDANPLEVSGESEYSINNEGQLVSKFDKPRNKDRGYSKDFYRAMTQFIDESAHVKHMNKVLPMVEAVEYLNKNGYADKNVGIKPNVAAWIDDWKKLHIFKEPHANDPVIDASVKFLRKLVASTTMWFNIPANAINVVVGNYNNWRQENGKILAKGNARLFGGKGARSKAGIVNKYALDIIRKYNIVNQDYDSNPNMKLNGIFSKLATIGTQIGEYQIQGSLGLGLMSDEDFNSFEYKKDKYGNDVLVVKKELNGKPVDEAALKERMIGVKNRVTDIQGKYPDEDRRNIMRGEIGKAVFQFKVWMPDWFKERFSAKYINARGETKQGTLRALYGEGFKQLKKQIKEDGLKKTLWDGKSVESRNFRSNIKGLMAIGTMLALTHQDDEDEGNRNKVTLAQNLMGQILFILDLEQDKYMVSNPVAALGKLKDMIDAIKALVTLEENSKGEYVFDEKIQRLIPANKISKVADMVKSVTE